MPAAILTLSLQDFATILGPILVSGAVGVRILLKSIDSRLETLSGDIRSIHVRCEKNHPAQQPENPAAALGVLLRGILDAAKPSAPAPAHKPNGSTASASVPVTADEPLADILDDLLKG